jgi:hypothetical protein
VKIRIGRPIENSGESKKLDLKNQFTKPVLSTLIFALFDPSGKERR